MVGWLVVLRITVDLAIFQPYLDLEAGDNQSLKIQVARPGIEPRSSCSASQELNHSATAALRGMFEVQKSGDKTRSGEISLDIRTHASPKVGQDQVSGVVSVLRWHAAPVAYVLWKPCTTEDAYSSGHLVLFHFGRDQSLLNLSCLRTFEFRTSLGTSLLH